MERGGCGGQGTETWVATHFLLCLSGIKPTRTLSKERKLNGSRPAAALSEGVMMRLCQRPAELAPPLANSGPPPPDTKWGPACRSISEASLVKEKRHASVVE